MNRTWKRLLAALLSATMLLGTALVAAPEQVRAAASSSDVTVDGRRVDCAGYAIVTDANGYANTYFKLRDVAMALNGTEKQFNVSWDGPRGTILISTGTAYVPEGGELAGRPAGEAAAVRSASPVLIDGVTASLTAYTIGGNNYFMLRDLGRALNFGVDWVQSTASIAISSTRGYSAAPSELKVCIASEPKTIDPALNVTVDGAILISHLFEGLIKRVDDGTGNAKRVPGQAASWEKSAPNADGEVTWTFHLRPDIKWSDGQAVTAGDFVYAWRRLADPATAADYAYQLDMVKGYAAVSSGAAAPETLAVSAPDDRTFVVTLSYDCPYFEDIVAFPNTYPVRQDMVEAHDYGWTFDPDTCISNGPYRLSAWTHNSYITMEKSGCYYNRDAVTVDTLTFALMDDDNAMLKDFRRGELQFIQFMPISEIPALRESGELKVVPYLGTYFAIFNNSRPPFDDPKVRKAFSLAIDRQAIVADVTQTGEAAADALVPPGIYDAAGPGSSFYDTGSAPYYSTGREDYAANCAEARRLLAEAGYPNGEGFPLVNYIYNTNDNHRQIAEALRVMWHEALGVDVQVNEMDWNAFIDAREKGEYDISRHGWITDYNDPMSFLDMWTTGNGYNDARVSNAAYDAYLAAAKSSADPAARMAAMHSAEDLLMEDAFVAPIYFYTNMYLLAPNVKGLVYDPMGYFLFTYCTVE